MAVPTDPRAWLDERCREAGLRRTRGLAALLDELATDRTPRSLGQLHGCEGLRDFDQATVYRQLVKLVDHGIVRELGLHRRALAYFLLLPGEHRDFLICRRCGKIESLSLAICPAHELEAEVAAVWGFQDLYHELEFFGLCPACSGSPAAPVIHAGSGHHGCCD